MSHPDLVDGLPRTILNQSDNLGLLQERYGNFAVTVLAGITDVDPIAPRDILTFGENWYQLTETRSHPNSDQDRIIQSKLPVSIFVDHWPIMARLPNEDILALMKLLQQGVQARTLDDRILEKLAVLDLAPALPPIRRSSFLNPQDTPWGVSGILQWEGVKTTIYHITSGYSRQTTQDVIGKPGDDYSATIFINKRHGNR